MCVYKDDIDFNVSSFGLCLCWYVCAHMCDPAQVCVCVHFTVLPWVICASNSLQNYNHHITAVFPHTLWLAPLSAFGNVCLQSLASLHLEHAPGKLPDLCAIRLVVISSASALLSPMRMLQLSVLCC